MSDYKNIFYTLGLVILLSSCKPTSTIVTSKEEAKRRGIYNTSKSNSNNRVATNEIRKTSETSKTASKNLSSKKSTINDAEDPDFIPDNDNTPYLVKQLINTALEFEGVKYKGGGTTKSGMDCSGLVSTVFNNFDITLPRRSVDMSKVGKKLNKNEIRKGDLVFFKTNGKNVINHVGMVTDVRGEEIIFIHASVQRGVIISSIKEPYYQRTFAQANRVL